MSPSMFLRGQAVLFVCLVPAMLSPEPQKSSYVDSTKTTLGGAFFKTSWNSRHWDTFASTISIIMSFLGIIEFLCYQWTSHRERTEPLELQLRGDRHLNALLLRTGRHAWKNSALIIYANIWSGRAFKLGWPNIMRKDLCYYTMYLVRSDLNGNVGGYREIFQQRTKRQRYLKIIGPNIMRHVRSYVQQTELLTGVPHFVRYCFYMNFHLRGTATLTSVAWSSAVELPLHVLTIYVFAAGIRTSNLPHARQTL